jgi:probable rRNA maturation factor
VAVTVVDRQRAVPRAKAACRRAAELVLQGRPAVVALVDDRAIAGLHARFLGVRGPTDVLTFPGGEGASEIVVSGETALREARARGVAPLHELLLYVVHGALHLMGHDDRTPRARARMRAAERAALRRLGLGDVFGAPAGKAPRAACEAA